MGGALHGVGWHRWLWWRCVAKPRLAAIVLQSSATVGGIFEFHEVPFISTNVTVPSVRDKCGWVVEHGFQDELSKL